jgi:predicted transcriptional regulator
VTLPDLSRFEFACLQKLWARGEATVRDIHGDLPQPPTYSTVRKIVERLEEKGAIERARRQGKAWTYHPRVEQSEMVRKEVDRLVAQVFDGSAERLIDYLARSHVVSLKDLRGVEKRLEKRKKKKKKKKSKEATGVDEAAE